MSFSEVKVCWENSDNTHHLWVCGKPEVEAGEGSSKDASLIGFEQYDQPGSYSRSDPGRYFKTKTASGTAKSSNATYIDPPSGREYFWGSNQTSWSGQDTYDESNVLTSGITQDYHQSDNADYPSSCPAATEVTNALGGAGTQGFQAFTWNISETETSYSRTLSEYTNFDPEFHVICNAGPLTYTLSDEDTEAAALARQSAGTGNLVSYYGKRIERNFSVRTASYIITIPGCVVGYDYTVTVCFQKEKCDENGDALLPSDPDYEAPVEVTQIHTVTASLRTQLINDSSGYSASGTGCPFPSNEIGYRFELTGFTVAVGDEEVTIEVVI